MADLRRAWLLRLYQLACESVLDESRLQLLQAEARALGIGCSLHRLPAHTNLDHLAVALVHRLEMGESGLRIWSGVLQPAGMEGPAQRLALNAARLLAGREELLVLAGALDGMDGRSVDNGALVDGETCARVAVAGLDPETELQCNNSAEALQAAGDLLTFSEGALGTNYLVLGLKLGSAAAEPLTRLHGLQRLRMV
ncbi:MAG: MOFRL family protein [Steroidobacteraceae bacterium]